MKFKLLFLFLFFISLRSLAAWPPEVIKLVNRVNSGWSFLTPHCSSILDKFNLKFWQAKNKSTLFSILEKGEIIHLKIQGDHFANKRSGKSYALSPSSSQIPGWVYWQRDSEGLIQKAPLVVLLPGMSYWFEKEYPLYTIWILATQGYHIISWPNSSHHQYLSLMPRYHSGSYEQEAKIIYEATKNFIETYFHNMSERHLLGFSSGASLGLMVKVLDLEAPNSSLFDGNTTLLGPMLKIKQTLDIIDHSMSLPLINRKFSPLSSIMGNAFQKRLYDIQLSLKATYDYHKNMNFKNRVYPMEVVTNLEKIPVSFFPSFFKLLEEEKVLINFNLLENPEQNFIQIENEDRLNHWLNQVNFSKTIENFYPQNVRDFYKSEKDQLSYQLKLIEDYTHCSDKKIRVLLTENDILNNPERLKDLEKFDDPRCLLKVNYGGHLGFVASSWFEKLARLSFPEP